MLGTGTRSISRLLKSSLKGRTFPATRNAELRCWYFQSASLQKIHGFGGDIEMSEEAMRKIIKDEEQKINEEEAATNFPDWKTGERKRPLIKTYSEEEFLRELMPEKFVDDQIWTLRDRRCGALAIKVGMMPVWDNWGVRHGCTVLWLQRNVVVGHKTIDKHGYSAILVAAGERKPKNAGKCLSGQFQHSSDLKKSPPYLVREFRVTNEENLLPLDSAIHARHFVPGQNIDVAAVSKGKGFQGAMKRHNFGGMPASHGTSLSHRALGSTGQCQDPGKVFKGKKMAGRMGGERVSVQNLRVVKVDRGRDLLYIVGAVPGQQGAFVEIQDAVKKPLWDTDDVLDSIKRPPLPTFEYDLEIDGSGICYEESMPCSEDDPLDPDYMDTTIQIKAQA